MLFVSPLYVPRIAALAAELPIIFACEILATALFWRLGLKESWI